MLHEQIGAIRRWIAVGAAVACGFAGLTAFGGAGARSLISTSASPSPIHGTPAPCGTPVASWGAATADDVRVQLVSVQRSVVWGMTGTPLAATPDAHVPVLSVDLEIANLGPETVHINAEDVTLTTCSGLRLQPATDLLGMKSPLGSFSPGDSRRGEIQFRLERDEAPAELAVAIQEERRTGAQITCPLVLDLGTTSTGAVSAGCSAQGGTGQSGAAGAAGPETTATVTVNRGDTGG